MNVVFLLSEIKTSLLSLNTTPLLDKYLTHYMKLSLNPFLASFERYMHWNMLQFELGMKTHVWKPCLTSDGEVIGS